MKLSQPRICPLEEEEWNSFQRELLEPVKGKQPFYNVAATLAKHESAAEKFNVWAYHVMGETSTLSGRHREILILRVGWLCDAEYEWGQHVIFGRKEGLTDTDFANIKVGSSADGWTDIEKALLDAVDELHEDSIISDSTWELLASEFTEKQMMDVVFAVGQYHLVSMLLNSFGVQLDKGVDGF